MAGSISSTDFILLIPGLWMPSWVMLPLALRLGNRGLRCACFGYPSSTGSLEDNAERLAGVVRSIGAGSVHLVGHSFGGVLALHAAASRRLARVRSIVMMGSPAQGSYSAARLAERDWGRRMLGRAVPDWIASPQPAAPDNVAVGIIAGTTAFGLGMIFVPDLAKPHDGVIRVQETQVSGAVDSVEVPLAHAALLTSARVAALVTAFLRHGRFDAGGRLEGVDRRSYPVPIEDGRARGG